VNPIVFENWIKSDLIYVNDILDSTNTSSSKFILEKLKFKSNTSFLPVALKYFNGISFQLEICPVTSLLTQDAFRAMK
jgi:hypothetical protein